MEPFLQQSSSDIGSVLGTEHQTGDRYVCRPLHTLQQTDSCPRSVLVRSRHYFQYLPRIFSIMISPAFNVNKFVVNVVGLRYLKYFWCFISPETGTGWYWLVLTIRMVVRSVRSRRAMADLVVRYYQSRLYWGYSSQLWGVSLSPCLSCLPGRLTSNRAVTSGHAEAAGGGLRGEWCEPWGTNTTSTCWDLLLTQTQWWCCNVNTKQTYKNINFPQFIPWGSQLDLCWSLSYIKWKKEFL